MAGLSSSAVAAELSLSPGTVTADISAILATLGLQNRNQLRRSITRAAGTRARS